MVLERILLVHKKSLYQIYVEEHHDTEVEQALRRGEEPAKRLRLSHDIQTRALDEALRAVDSLGIDVHVTWRGESFTVTDVDLVITIGGDGTVLDTSHRIRDATPLMGVNSQPDVSAGVLCAGVVGNLSNLLQDLIADRLKPMP